MVLPPAGVPHHPNAVTTGLARQWRVSTRLAARKLANAGMAPTPGASKARADWPATIKRSAFVLLTPGQRTSAPGGYELVRIGAKTSRTTPSSA
jgi:hypothetical protein